MRIGFDLKKWAKENVNAFTPDVQKIINDGNYRAQLRTYYSNIRVTNLGEKAPLVNHESQTPEKGVTNLDKGKIPGVSGFLLMFIGLSYDTHATETSVFNRNFSNSVFNHADGTVRLPGVFRNAEFNLEVGGVVRFQNLVDQFFVENRQGETLRGDFRNKLSIIDNPILLSNNATIIPFLAANNGAAVPANNHFFRTELIGLEIQKA